MVAEFSETIEETTLWLYCRLFWAEKIRTKPIIQKKDISYD
jgi:hypothetical protein